MNGSVMRALVTGAGRRVGRAIALELARAGCDVAVHYHRSETEASELVGQITARGRRAVAVPGDLSDPSVPASIVNRTCEQLGGLDLLVNNAAIFTPDPDEGFDLSYWQRVFQVNTFAPAALIEAARPALAQSGSGVVVNVCDISAERPWRRHSAYCASKAALANLTKAYARALAPDIRVNGVAPGVAMFPDDYSADVRDRLVAKVPLARGGMPEDVAKTVRFLLESGDYITGQIIRVDGGRSLV